jgi:hypothetical protein
MASLTAEAPLFVYMAGKPAGNIIQTAYMGASLDEPAVHNRHLPAQLAAACNNTTSELQKMAPSSKSRAVTKELLKP